MVSWGLIIAVWDGQKYIMLYVSQTIDKVRPFTKIFLRKTVDVNISFIGNYKGEN